MLSFNDNHKKALTVSQINLYIKEIIEHDQQLSDIWLIGEITNIKHYKIGNQLYFTLSDDHSQINCVIFQSFINNITFDLKNGQKVCARGKLRIYQKRGTYNFQVAYMMPIGVGDLALAFEKLKTKLAKEGLFNPEYKQEIPLYPQRIALITAPGSAAMIDFISIFEKLAPQAKLYLVPTVMQGVKAPLSIMSSLDILAKFKKIDVVIILRGGGSPEDLACFNDEALIRSIFAFSIPVVAAIGHEIDYTLTDFVADLRLPTPTAAAQALGQPFVAARIEVQNIIEEMKQLVQDRFSEIKAQLTDLLKNTSEQTGSLMNTKKELLEVLLKRLDLANPLHKLQQGFSICRHLKTRKIIKSIRHISPETELEFQLRDGSCEAKVIQIHEY